MVVVPVNQLPEVPPLKRVGILRGANVGSAKVEVGVSQDWRLHKKFQGYIVRSCEAAAVGDGWIGSSVPADGRNFTSGRVNGRYYPVKL